MAQLHETKLPRFKIANRRGVWTTWQFTTTWSACLLRSPTDENAACLDECPSIRDVQDITNSVFDGTFGTLDDESYLLVESQHQAWATVVKRGGYDDNHDTIEAEFQGDVLRTGSVDQNGIVYVWLSRSGKRILDFRTDGMGWPTLPEDVDDDDEFDDDDDNRDIFIFETSLYPDDWPHTFPRVEAAHQQLIIDLDAYVPHLTFHSKLAAEYGHEDATDSKNIKRISLVRLES